MWDQNNKDFIGWEKAKIKFGFDECEKVHLEMTRRQQMCFGALIAKEEDISKWVAKGD
jgi:hypothetical protein